MQEDTNQQKIILTSVRKPDEEKDGTEGLYTYCGKTKCKRKKTYKSSDKGTKGYQCTLSDKIALNCPFKSKHRKMSRVYNPHTGRMDKQRIHPTNNLKDALPLHLAFIKELEDNNYNMVQPETEKPKPIVLVEAAGKYIDFLKGENVPEHKRKNVTKGNWKKRLAHIRWMFDTIKTRHKLSNLLITSIDDNIVSFLYSKLEQKETPSGDDISGATFNDYLKSWNAFYNWLIEWEKHEITNPFEHCTKKPEKVSARYIEDWEFDLFISMITPENSKGFKGTNNQPVYHYKDYLVQVFTGMITTGARRADFFDLKGSSIEGDLLIIKDEKNTKIKGKTKERFAFIQGLLKDVIDSSGYIHRDKDDYLFVPDVRNRKTLASKTSRAFRHFWNLTGLKHATLHDLRKTFVTKNLMANGVKGLNATHDNEEVALTHYFSQRENAKEMKEGTYNYKHVKERLKTI